MVFRKSPAYLWQYPSGQWHFKRPIPPGLRAHYNPNAKGKQPTHIVVPLGTHSRVDAERLKRPHAAAAEATFRRLSGHAPSTALEQARGRLAEVREAMVTLNPDGSDESWGATTALEDIARDAAEVIEREQGAHAADLAYRVATDPKKRTLKQHQETWLPGSGLKKQTQGDHGRVLKELLEFLKVSDCLPESVTKTHAVGFAAHLNSTELSRASKKQRTSKLGAFWKYLQMVDAVPPERKGIWHDLFLTHGPSEGAAKGAGGEGVEDFDDVRTLSDAEVVLLLTEPDQQDNRKRTYGRALFSELYALGLTTGMRLNEICSLRPRDIEKGDGWDGLIVKVRDAKTKAGNRDIPVVHPAAVRLLNARVDGQKDARGWIFSECQPGGPDMKQSWHVQKALGRDRDRLKLDPSAVFHTTRATFITRLEELGVNSDHIKRYVGHAIEGVTNNSYTGRIAAEARLPLARALGFGKEVEEALAHRIAYPERS